MTDYARLDIDPTDPTQLARVAVLDAAMRPGDEFRTRIVFGALAPVAADVLHLALRDPGAFASVACDDRALLGRVARCWGARHDWMNLCHDLDRLGVPADGVASFVRAVREVRS